MIAPNYTLQFYLFAVAMISAFLLIFGHLILAKSFAGLAWVEYTAAAIPFVLLILCIFGFRYTIKEEKSS
ncbi:hypothetical protein [Vibrio aquimaris]|uniref:Asparaginyl-tRNA synthetase n=1 Tax=Vibrio aquimaris TaxID=2587862 RepID=A0A5P9CJQ5_9VIBR|nr:hypothetical protein [Vibrio aquimaris]QFT26500.1 hypothetical protein FIV01_08670 [Vibrio aquimaris]